MFSSLNSETRKALKRHSPSEKSTSQVRSPSGDVRTHGDVGEDLL